MKRFFILFFIILFISSCSSSEQVQKPVEQKKPVEKSSNQKSTEEAPQDELLNLIQNDKGTEDTSNSGSLDNVSYETLDGKPIKEANKDTLQKSETTKAVKEDVKRKEYIDPKMESGDKKDNSDELLAQINALKNQVKSKEETIESLKNQNSDLKVSSAKNITVTLQDKISDEDYKMKYDEAYQLLLSKNYDVAISIFENLILSNSQHSLADNAQYWIGEAHFAQRKYNDAILDFEKVFTFAKSNKNEDSQFKIGLCYYLIKDFENARIEMNRFISKYPNSRNTERANSIINKM